MVIILIVGLMATLAVPVVVGQNAKAQRDQALARLSADVQAARRLAMRRRAPVEVSFDGQSRELVLWADLNRNGSVDDGEVSRRRLTGNGVVTWELPSQIGVFNSKGFFSSPNGYLQVSVRCDDCHPRSLYVFPSGEVYESEQEE
jgi:Tfp pilus assembly protein FimT